MWKLEFGFKWVAMGAIVLVGVIGSMVSGCSGRNAGDRFKPAPVETATVAVSQAQPVPSPSATPDKDSAVRAAIDQINPAVVTIMMAKSKSAPRGLGVIIDPQGYIVTNDHIVRGASNIKVILADGREIDARLVGADSVSDVAVLQVRGLVPAVAVFGDSSALVLGQATIVIGGPRGAVTMGVVSALNRTVGDQTGLIQTDAAIDNDDSGGPLLNSAGQVIGLVTVLTRRPGDKNSEKTGAAIPSNQVRAIAAQLILSGRVERPYLGIRYRVPDVQQAGAMGLAAGEGVLVLQVQSGSPADTAGLKPGDVILAVGDRRIDRGHSFLAVLFAHAPRDRVNLTVWQEGKQTRIALTLGTHPESRPDLGGDIN